MAYSILSRNSVTMKQQFLIINPGPDIEPFMQAVADGLKRRDVTTTMVDEIKLGSGSFDLVSIPDGNIADIIKFTSTTYNPKNNRYLEQQIINYAIKCLSYLKKLFDQNDFTDVIVWNGWPVLTQAAIYWAKKHNAKVWYMENGFLPNTLQLDDKGVNFFNSLSKKGADFYLESIVKPQEISPSNDNAMPYRRPWRLTKTLQLFFIRFRWMAPIIIFKYHLSRRLNKWLRKAPIRYPISALPDRFIFVPFQVEEDTQITMLSPYIKNMEDLLDICYSTIKKVDPTIPIVVKEHPCDFGRQNYKKLIKKYPDIIWLKTYPMENILKKATVVITINSGVGVEALAQQKQVITLGEAFYNTPGLVHYADRPQNLPQLIYKALNEKPNHLLIDKFIKYLQHNYLISGSWKRFSQATIDQVINRLLQTQ